MKYDVLIIGSGAAGLLSALYLDQSLKIAILAKNNLSDGSTSQAQGGISAVLAAEDSFASHIRDTENAGAGLCRSKVVQFVVQNAPNAIDKLETLGLKFNKSNKKYHLNKEGGHSHRRVVHVADYTGKALSDTLESKVKKQTNIDIFTHHIAIDLITDKTQKMVNGCYVLDIKKDVIKTFQANYVVLATGGASKIYLYSSNQDGATGDGIAMAYRAGCSVANMEFNQFHPTCLFHPHAKSFLISEAVRGEGATLLLPNGKRFMKAFDQRAELAPRDIVARAIDHQMKRFGIDNVLLDLSFKSSKFINKHFPKINKEVKKYGFDIATEPLPVVPAAHYTCGGVVADLNGKTNLQNLYAVGEVAHTGLHGANRIASNSLLECLVFAKTVAHDINQKPKIKINQSIKKWDESRVSDSDERVIVSHNWDELRRCMWDFVGIVRTDKRLNQAKRRVSLLQKEVDEYYENFKVHSHFLELRNLVQVAEIVINSAIRRKESRGLHYNLDHPDELPDAKDTVLNSKLS